MQTHSNATAPKLSGVPETLLIPLWARAAEHDMPRPIVQDQRAVELVERIDYDFSRFQKSRFSQLGVAVRTQLLDDAVRGFLARAPKKPLIINLGAGLDTRHARRIVISKALFIL